MITLLQIATGSSVREEVTDYVVANKMKNIKEGVQALFLNDYNFMGKYKDCTVGVPNKFGEMKLRIAYIDEYDDEETTEWELRPVKAFL